jgi:hypothetical protein
VCLFVFIENGDGNKKKPIGTGFFVNIIDERTSYNPYFVTDKHVLQIKPGKFYDKIHIRLNTRNNLAEYIDINLSENKCRLSCILFISKSRTL